MNERTLRRSPDDSDSKPAERVGGLVTALTLTTAFGALALGIPYWWVAFPVGFGAVMPLAVGEVKSRTGARTRRDGVDAADGTSKVGRDDALETLRDRYASGAIDEAEFERRVEGLLATEESPGESGRRVESELERDRR